MLGTEFIEGVEEGTLDSWDLFLCTVEVGSLGRCWFFCDSIQNGRVQPSPGADNRGSMPLDKGVKVESIGAALETR